MNPGMNLNHRVRQLEAAHSSTQTDDATIAERRVRLAPYLIDDRYFTVEQREAILAALCEGTPAREDDLCYELRQTHDAEVVAAYAAITYTRIDWRTRDSGGAPQLIHFVLPVVDKAPADVR